MNPADSQIYRRTAGALFVLLLLTVGAAYLDLGPFNTPVAMLISATKALLIVLVFMHLRQAPALTVIAALAGFFWLAIFLSLTLSDYATRAL